MDFSAVNWLAVAVATVLAFVIVGIWYGPLFGKAWQGLVGLSDEDIGKTHPGMVFGPAFLLTLVQAAALATLMGPGVGLLAGALFGTAVGATLVATGFGVNYLFARKPRGLWGIDAGFNVVQLSVMGAVLGAWP